MSCNLCGCSINSEDEFKAGICNPYATLAVICRVEEAPQAKNKDADEFHSINKGLEQCQKK